MILWIWQLPQHLLALIMIKVLKAEKKGKYYIYSSSSKISPFTLGQYIFIKKVTSEKSIKHEEGHSVQSKYLGPLYLIVVGLPSLIGNIVDRYFDIDYYNLLWEKSADKLGGVKR